MLLFGKMGIYLEQIYKKHNLHISMHVIFVVEEFRIEFELLNCQMFQEPFLKGIVDNQKKIQYNLKSVKLFPIHNT